MSKFVETKMRHDALMADLFWNDMVTEAKIYLINKHLTNGDLHITEEGIDFVGREKENTRVVFRANGEVVHSEMDEKR